MKNNRREFLNKVSKAGAALLAAGAASGTALEAKGGKKGGNNGSTTLSEEKKDKLFYIFQEEKVARDIYITLGELYPEENTFAMIQLSEQRHIEAAGTLCDTYGVDTSYVNLDFVGQFELPLLQQLYDTCVEQGSISKLDALKVGELIELTDIDDLESAMVGMPQDVVNVFSNLKAGSLNHLDAFRRAI
ncbi:MAG: DUF2202 domain-containing protein, partial [Campylobacterales bacterium]